MGRLAGIKHLVALVILCRMFVGASAFAAEKNSEAPASDSKNAADSHARQIDAIMRKDIPEGEAMPGAVVLVARNGTVVFSGAYGFADVGHKIPLKPDTVFDLASCSKQFTAVAILMLVDRGKIGLDDDVHKYLPEIPTTQGRAMRVADLLHMTEGLESYMNWFDSLDTVKNADIAREAAHAHKLAFQPGAKYEYSNTAYALLAVIVQRVTRQPFAHFMHEEIFKPLGMRHTMVLDNPHTAVPDRAQGYTRNAKGFKPAREDTPIVGDGQVVTNVEDLVLWDKALREGTLLKPDVLKHAYAEGKLNNGKGTASGMGYSLTEAFDKKWAWHSGGWTGTATYVSRCLDDGLLVVVLSNNDKFNSEGHGARIEKMFEKHGSKSEE